VNVWTEFKWPGTRVQWPTVLNINVPLGLEKAAKFFISLDTTKFSRRILIQRESYVYPEGGGRHMFETTLARAVMWST
jgi:hypothetical protein